MADLVSMKLSAADKKARETELTKPYEPDPYPWGLSIDLDTTTLDKLGVKDLSVGQELELVAKVRVRSASSSEYEGGESNRSACLQITDMALSFPSQGPGAADVLYGKG